MNRKIVFAFIAIYGLAAGTGYFMSGQEQPVNTTEPGSYILQGKTTQAVVNAVLSVDGEVTHEFSMINAVAATLTLEQRDNLLVNPVILAINEDAPVRTSGGSEGGLFPLATLDGAQPASADL